MLITFTTTTYLSVSIDLSIGVVDICIHGLISWCPSMVLRSPGRLLRQLLPPGLFLHPTPVPSRHVALEFLSLVVELAVRTRYLILRCLNQWDLRPLLPPRLVARHFIRKQRCPPHCSY